MNDRATMWQAAAAYWLTPSKAEPRDFVVSIMALGTILMMTGRMIAIPVSWWFLAVMGFSIACFVVSLWLDVTEVLKRRRNGRGS